jgi:Questin oxidase-like
MTGIANVNRNLLLPQIPSKNISWAFPGITQEARDTVADLLLENHVESHCFFNEKKFHNHLVHGVLAAYSLGAKPDRIKAIYKDHASYQKPIGTVLTTFTESDWKSQLGNAEYYASYLEFFHKEVAKLGRNEAFIKYALEPDMIARSFSGAFHPLIHMGYGFDFEVDGILAEGLAMAALTSTLMGNVIVRPTSSIEKVASKVATQLSLTKSSSEPKTIVEMLTSIREDRDLDDVCPFSQPDKTAHGAKNEKAINKIQQCLAAWDVEGIASLPSIWKYFICLFY